MPEKNLTLHIVGEGTQEQMLKQLLTDQGEEEHVQFFPRVSQKELVPFYQSFDIAVFLSRSESFGVSILEASSCELPVVVTAIGGLTEVVDDKKTGFFVPPEDINAAADKIIALIKDSELRRTMGKAGREKVIKEYDIENTLNDILNIYKEEDSCE
jgi:glycosyltransferase involved in cell wall biosynthesis